MINFDYVKLFYELDSACVFEGEWKKSLIEEKSVGSSSSRLEPSSPSSLSMGEALTILVWFHLSGWRCFKNFYFHLERNYKNDFPKLPSYNRFVELQPHYLVPLVCLLNYNLAECSDKIGFIDATPIKVCHKKRIHSNKVFKTLARVGKSTMGCFFGFKLHIIINSMGELVSVKLSKGNCDDRVPVKDLCKNIQSGSGCKIFGDKGYISQTLFEEMLTRGIKIITQLKKNMKHKLIDMAESLILKKRSLIESVFHIMKDMLHIEHSRHRSPKNFLVNLFAALVAYCFYPNKPKMRLPDSFLKLPAKI